MARTTTKAPAKTTRVRRKTVRKKQKRTLFGEGGLLNIGAKVVGLKRTSSFRSPLAVAFVLFTAGTLATVMFRASASTVSQSLWTTEKPVTSAVSDTRATELGVKFTSSQAGTVSAVKFYKGRNNSGTHKGSLWTSTGQLLGTATFTNETSTGWQTAYFTTPIAVTPGTQYVASYYAPKGRYAQDKNYFNTGRTSGALTAPGLNTSVANGVYKTGSGFPATANSQSNYWVDLVLNYETATPTPSPTVDPSATPVVTPTPTSTPTNPAGIVGGYWQMWQGPNVSEITANAPQYNLQYAAFAMGSDSQGHVAFNPVFESGTALKTDIAASKAAGSTWLLSLGGGSDSTIRLTTETQATNMFNSLVPIIDSYGFQGIDFDLECGSTCFNPTSAVSLASKLKAKYGQAFLISATPRPYEVRSSSTIYAKFAVQAGNNLDILGMQFYDFTEANTASTLASIIDSDIKSVTGMGIPASKILIGCITYSKYQYGHNTVDVYKNIYLAQKAKYPSLRGVFIWETSLDKLENWSFAKTMGTTVRGL